MSFYGMFTSKGPSGFGYRSTAEQVTDGLSLDGKTILITGCSSGLGLETMRVLTLRGARVVGIARTLHKCREACRSVTKKTIALECELSEPASIRTCITAVQREGIKLDALICNAGIMALPKLELEHGFEKQFFVNHIGHFILVTGLLDQLADDGRVVMLSSGAHNMAPKGGMDFDNLDGHKDYSPWRAYGQSKFANLLFAKELAHRFVGSKKTANAVHPGVINTNLGRHMGRAVRMASSVIGPLAWKSIPQGAATQTYVAVHPAVATISGAYFADCNVAKCRPDANDAGLAKRLWEVSEEIVARVASI
jgi:NAD(P)-dependent dehydrogenase (short-subunit alcohol dehydrogenase family)